MRLGLIGDSIAKSRAPVLHKACGDLTGVEVSYQLFSPLELDRSFDEVFADCVRQLDGFNITMPYKGRAAQKVQLADPILERLDTVNTIRITPDGPVGHNTDHTGFLAAYRAHFGVAEPGRVVVFGAGGVGRAVVFGLAALGATDVVIVDSDVGRADALAASASEVANGGCRIVSSGPEALNGAEGVINCTPLGMGTSQLSPVPEGRFPPARWAFDAVYTPVNTPFRAQALSAGAEFVSGFELFFHQGIHCFELFSGRHVADQVLLRELLDLPETGT